MSKKPGIDSVYAKSENVVARDIQGELIIIPIISDMPDKGDEIFTLNETGRIIWDKIDGKRKLRDIAKDLVTEFKEGTGEIEKDTLGFTNELFKRKMIVDVK